MVSIQPCPTGIHSHLCPVLVLFQTLCLSSHEGCSLCETALLSFVTEPVPMVALSAVDEKLPARPDQVRLLSLVSK